MNEEKEPVAETEETTPQNQEENSEDWKEKYLRTLAEMENMRKRMQKERHEMTQFGIESALGEFLHAIDNFENALRFAEGGGPEVKSWAQGFEMILSQFKEALQTQGITAFHSEGKLFDPQSHEAVEIIETDEVPEGTILQEFTKGYRSAARIVRPARVKVAKQPLPPAEEAPAASTEKDAEQEELEQQQ